MVQCLLHRISYSSLLFLIALLFTSGLNGRERCIIIKSGALKDQLLYSETIYRIVGTFDLQGDTLKVPYGSTLNLERGVLKNGSIKGDNSKIRLKKECIDNVELLEGIKSINTTVKASVYVRWEGKCLSSLCAICPDCGRVVLDKDFDYVFTKTIVKKESITIDGRNRFVHLEYPDRYYKYDKYAPCFLNAKNTGYIILKNIKFDGGFVPFDDQFGGKSPNEWFISIDSVDNVVIKRCLFKGIKVDFSNWQEVPASMILINNYHNVLFCNNTILDCKTPEGVLIKHDDTYSADLAVIRNNTFNYFWTSSCLNVYFGRFKINNNYFGPCIGSAINAFGYNSELLNNRIKGSYRSVGIDISEFGAVDHISHDILIKGNVVDFCHDGFFAGHNIYNVSLENNVYDANIIPKDFFDFLDTRLEVQTRVDRYMLYLEGNNQDVLVKNNVFQGGNRLWSPGTEKNKTGVKEINNMVVIDNW